MRLLIGVVGAVDEPVEVSAPAFTVIQDVLDHIRHETANRPGWLQIGDFCTHSQNIVYIQEDSE